MATASSNSPVIRFGAYEADLRTGELRKHGLRIKLQDQPFQILAMLLERPGELVTREQIQAKLWPADTFVDFDHSLNTAIRRLRDALSDSADNPRFIETLPRRGYRFLADVSTAGGKSASPEPQAAAAEPLLSPPLMDAAVAPAPAQFGNSAVPQFGSGSQSGRSAVRHFGNRWLLATLVVLAVAALLVWRLWQKPHTIDSIAVLPFANETKDASLDYIGDGIAETLIDNLVEIPGLRVVSRNSAFQLRNAKLSTREIAQRLGARAVLVGSVRTAGENFRISVELVDTRDDRHLWGQEYTFTRPQVAGIQPQLARELFDALRFKLDSAAQSRLAQQQTRTAAAYDAYLQGRFAFRTRNKPSLQQAVTHFQHAIDLDPNYALAYAGLADALSVSAYQGIQPPRTALPIADAAAQHALQLAPDRALVHVTWAYQLANWHHDLPAAIKEAEYAIKLDPNLADAHHSLGEFLDRSGRLEDSLEQRRIGLVLDPEWPVARTYYFFCMLHLERFAELESFIADQPLAKAAVRVLQGRYKEAADLYGEDTGQDPPPVVPLRAAAYIGAGRRADAEAILRRLLERRRASYSPASEIAAIYFLLGQRDQAFAWFNTAVNEFDMSANYIPTDPLYKPLHDDPRWQQLMRKLNTPQ